MLLRVDIASLNSSATISPVGEIDLDTVSLLSASLADTIASGADRVVPSSGRTSGCAPPAVRWCCVASSPACCGC